MEIFLKWFALACVQLAATMSPGPAFVLSVRNAMRYDLRSGLFTALGLGFGVGAHVCFIMIGFSVIITKYILLYNFIKYAGAAYLIYIGLKALRSKKTNDQSATDAGQELIVREMQKPVLSARKSFTMGLMTNLLNPKAVVFFTAVYSQFLTPHTPFEIHVLYGFTSVTIETLWFSGVALVLANPVVKSKFMSIVHWIERGCGGLMIALGLKLAVSR